jgi:hypothetical protein
MAKEARFAACTSPLTSPATHRPPPKCGAFRLQPRGSPLRQTGCWRKPDSNSQSHPRERVSFGDKPTQIPKAMSWQTNGRRRLLAQDYDETAEDLEIGASEIRPPELLPEGKRPR